MTSLIKREEERNDNYKRWPYDNLQQNQRRRMKLQIELRSQQRDHRLSRAAWLQSRWLEISEQERRAQLHNQKLLQDFQRAQDTLDDMVARTEAMNTIRIQYERYLEENFPRWQQKFKDMLVSEQSKQEEMHLKNYSQQMEEDNYIKAEHRSDITAHPVFANSADQSQHPTSHAILNTHQTQKDIRQNDHLYLPPTWLTGSHPLSSRLPQNNIPKDYKNFHNIQALNHHFPPYFSLPCDLHCPSHSPVQQKSSSIDPIWQNQWAGIRQGFTSTGHFTPNASWPQLPVLNPIAWGTMDVPDPGREKIQCGETDQDNTTKEMMKPPKESNKRLKHKRKGREHNESSKLDCGPDHKDSSEGNAVSSVKVSDSGMKDRRKKRREKTHTSHFTANGRESQGFSTVSQNTPMSASGGKNEPRRSKKHQKPSSAAKQDTSKGGKITENNDLGKDDNNEESKSQEILPSHASSDKLDETEQPNQNSAEEEDPGDGEDVYDLTAEEKISEREVVDEGEEEDGADDNDEEAGLDKAQKAEEERNDKAVRSRDETEPSDGEEIEREGDIPDNIPASDSKEEGEKTKGEIEENSSRDELVKGTRGRTCKSERKDENDEEENDNNVDINIQINNSLKELYAADETEDEEVSNQEIEDDEIVVEQAYPWSKDPLYETKCHDDDNEDIEDLLNPKFNSQTHQEDDVEETDQPNGEEDLAQKTVPASDPVESDDEFDHFYD